MNAIQIEYAFREFLDREEKDITEPYLSDCITGNNPIYLSKSLGLVVAKLEERVPIFISGERSNTLLTLGIEHIKFLENNFAHLQAGARDLMLDWQLAGGMLRVINALLDKV